jgi:hypothetical protein
MSATARAKKIAKIHSVLKKHYQPIRPAANRSVLEHLVFACCLEDSRYEQANDAFARIQEVYTGWNEVRVTTVKELAEQMTDLTDPIEAATRVKKTLYNVFESQYSWDMEYLRKENLGKATQKLNSYKSATPFVVSYLVQNALNGHSIPLDKSAMDLMLILDIVNQKEAAKWSVPGLERAVSKNLGVDFSSLLHQMSVDFRSSPFSTNYRNILLSIDSGAKDRFPKRQSKKKVVKTQESPPETKSASKAASKSASKAADAKKKAPAKPEPKKKVAKKASGTPAKKSAKTSGKTSAKKSAKAPAKKVVKKSPKKSVKTPAKKSVAKGVKKKSANKKLSKKKPR